MDFSTLLSQETLPQLDHLNPVIAQDQAHVHQYSTRRSMAGAAHDELQSHHFAGERFVHSSGISGLHQRNLSSGTVTPKNVTFELHFEGAPNYRGRLPMRVQIFLHDTTDSIITTVKNFYGLYEGAAQGVSFEDDQGNTLIARYENFKNDMTIYVRVIPDYTQRPELQAPWAYRSASPPKMANLDEATTMPPPQSAQILNYGQPPSRPGSRISRKQSASPRVGKGPQGLPMQRTRSRSGIKSHGSSFQAGLDELNSDTVNGYSDSDGGAGSVTSSRKARSEQLASAEISVDNIVEGGRRKRAKFESSELPLFVPPQIPVPNSISSISPQRRTNGPDNFSPFARPTQRTFAYHVPLPSPQASLDTPLGTSQNGKPFSVPPTNHTHRLRDRVSGATLSTRSSSGTIPRRGLGILPTPDPTIASCISDEDVALQLMRLGDASNISHGRTSASTLDDAFSGRAETASSVTSTSGDESDATEQAQLPPQIVQLKTEPSVEPPSHTLKKQHKHLEENVATDSTEPSGDEVDGDYEEGLLKSDPDDRANEVAQRSKSKPSKAKLVNNKIRAGSASTKSSKSHKQQPNGVHKKAKLPAVCTIQQSMPAPSVSNASRKTSSASTINFQHQPGVDENDLSSKPRCQRCRKSKKGCDRQRPCQRCVDAGIGIDGCVSEEEGNGRKGRYGRHMGVPVKKIGEHGTPDAESETAGAILTGMAGGMDSPEKSKKRKR